METFYPNYKDVKYEDITNQINLDNCNDEKHVDSSKDQINMNN